MWKLWKSFQLQREFFFLWEILQLVECLSICDKTLFIWVIYVYSIFLLQVIWDPAVSLLVNLWSDQSVCDQRGSRPSVYGVYRCHNVRDLQHHLTGGAPQHAHSHDEQLLPAHCCEHRSKTLQTKSHMRLWNRECLCWQCRFMSPNLGCRIMQTLSGNLPGQSCGWVTLKKGPLCLPRSTSSQAPNHSGTLCAGSRDKCARGHAPSSLKLLELSE